MIQYIKQLWYRIKRKKEQITPIESTRDKIKKLKASGMSATQIRELLRR